MNLAGQLRPAYLLYHTFWTALDWVFPPSCGGCGKVGDRWCSSCQQRMKLIAGNLCPSCGEPGSGSNLCQHCSTELPFYTALRSFGEFEGQLREALHSLKYQRNVGVGEALSKHLVELYNQLTWDVDIITPVPLGKQRLQERGYNQASVLARPFAYAIQKPYRTDILQKVRETPSQVSLSREARKQNISGAFTAREKQVRGKTILVIDDVTTTGATINACAQALRMVGASAVYGLTLARAVQKAGADDQPTQNSTQRR